MDGQQPATGDLSKVQEIYQKVLKEKDDLEAECLVLTDILVRKHKQNMESSRGLKDKKPIEVEVKQK